MGFEIENGVFKKYIQDEAVTEVVIPDGMTTIGDSAFRNCKSLTSVSIPDSVTSIGHWAFSACESLTDINIPNSMTWIGNHAFEGCESLTNIGDLAFEGCNLPDEVKKHIKKIQSES